MSPVIIALAVQRLTQLLVEDELTRPVREAITRWAAGAEEFSFRDRVAVLSSCPACMSVWAAAGILLASRVRVGRWVVGALAASGSALIVEAAVKALEGTHV